MDSGQLNEFWMIFIYSLSTLLPKNGAREKSIPNKNHKQVNKLNKRKNPKTPTRLPTNQST